MASTRTSQRPRIFIDSSVLMAAAISTTGRARDLVNLGFDGQLGLVVSDDVLEETERNLILKAPRALPAFHHFRAVLAATLISPSPGLVSQVATIVEPKDAPIVAGAIQAQALYIATYDRKHLLNQAEKIGAEYNIIVATPDTILVQQHC